MIDGITYHVDSSDALPLRLEDHVSPLPSRNVDGLAGGQLLSCLKH